MHASLEEILNSHRTARPIVMGVLNVTPDSFSDGGRFIDPARAVARAAELADQGADIIDIGAESTRPGSGRVPAEHQIARLAPILRAVCRLGPLVSIDTTLATVADFALAAGARIINDISAGRDDPQLLPLAADRSAPVILMHMQGTPADMQAHPHYDNVVTEVADFLAQRLDAAVAAGLPRELCLIDPGIGFGKTTEHNLDLLRNLDRLARLDRPMVIGVSRKRFIGLLSGADDPAERLPGSIAAACLAYLRGATIIRAHDVAATRQALAVARAIECP